MFERISFQEGFIKDVDSTDPTLLKDISRSREVGEYDMNLLTPNVNEIWEVVEYDR